MIQENKTPPTAMDDTVVRIPHGIRVPHVNAPVADFPVRKVIAAHHFLADLTLPYGQVLYYNNRALCRHPSFILG